MKINHLASDKFVTSAVIRHGLMPCTPYTPSTAITIRVLEVFRIHHLQSPHTSVKSWVKTPCTLQGMPFKAYLSRQFSIAFDLYLSILTFVDETVQTALNHDSPDWALLSCTIFHSALPSQIPSLFPLILPCSNVSGHSVTPSPPITPITLRHAPSCSVTSLHFPSLHFIFCHSLPFAILTVITVILVMFCHLDMILTLIN